MTLSLMYSIIIIFHYPYILTVICKISYDNLSELILQQFSTDIEFSARLSQRAKWLLTCWMTRIQFPARTGQVLGPTVCVPGDFSWVKSGWSVKISALSY